MLCEVIMREQGKGRYCGRKLPLHEQLSPSELVNQMCDSPNQFKLSPTKYNIVENCRYLTLDSAVKRQNHEPVHVAKPIDDNLATFLWRFRT